MNFDRVKDAIYPDTAGAEDFSFARVERLLACVRGEPVTDLDGTIGFEEFSRRVQPHSPGLASRMWYGGGSLRSARWAGEHGMNFLTSSVVKAEAHVAFREIDEVAFALPFTFDHDDYVQILTDTAELLGPALGWARGR